MPYVMDLRALVGSRPLLVPGACALLEDARGRLLLQRRSLDGTWGPPGGQMELGETLEECVRRELMEETGLGLGALCLLGVFSGPAHYYRHECGDENFNVTAAFVCREFSGSPSIKDDETLELNFFSINELPDDLAVQDRPIVDAYVSMRRLAEHR